MILSPFTARIDWQFIEAKESALVVMQLKALVRDIADETQQVEGAVIGHIKGLIRTGRGSLWISCVSNEQAPDTAGSLPEVVRGFNLDLAVIAYGISHHEIRNLVADKVYAHSIQTGSRALIHIGPAGVAIKHAWDIS